jgi:hypothetical protein
MPLFFICLCIDYLELYLLFGETKYCLDSELCAKDESLIEAQVSAVYSSALVGVDLYSGV